jgi:opacity protein-like surface antigen
MKKNLFFLAICLLLAGSVSAQGYYYGPRRVRRPPPRSEYDDFYKVRAGITGGLNVSNTINAYNSNYTTAAIAGFNAGFFLSLPLVYPLSFQPELLYSEKGYAESTPDGNFTQHANYVDVPLLLKFKVSPTFNFLIGPQVAIPVNTTNTYDNGFMVTNEQYYNTYGDKTVLDGVVGVSFDLSRDVELRIRYTVDLQPNEQTQLSTTSGAYSSDYRNQVWQVGLGFKFQ